MAEIAPFRALRYNLQLASPAENVTQPYDKISPAMQARYYAASPYNLVRIILGRSEEGDNTDKNVYTRAARSFGDWRKERILIQDVNPGIYAYSERFILPGTDVEQERLGFIALGRIEDYSAKIIFRHEQTLAKPKADRLELLRSTRAHFGQIFMLYEGGEVDSLLSSQTRQKPTIEVTDEYRVMHRIWPVSDPTIIKAIQEQMREKRLIIADGHHRYETALSYRDERRAANGADGSANDAPYEWLMMTFVNMSSPRLVILPTHRVVHGISGFSAEELARNCAQFFVVEELAKDLEATQFTQILRDKGEDGTALLAITSKNALLLHHGKPSAAQCLAGFSPRQRELDVVQLHKCLLEGVLKLSEESIRNQQNISYLRDAGEAIARVRADTANVAFLMNPCRVEQVRDVAFAGEVMPQKSTDFYPKLLSGLTIYALD
ncbi:MAG TPA: DUF1015 domain-containing protein [Candidatus Sulfotelmatobacter sp.]